MYSYLDKLVLLVMDQQTAAGGAGSYGSRSRTGYATVHATGYATEAGGSGPLHACTGMDLYDLLLLTLLGML